jgi:prolipoprotein diacylglyceryltransferase
MAGTKNSTACCGFSENSQRLMAQQFLSAGPFAINTQTLFIALVALSLCVLAWLPARDWRVPMNATVVAACALVVGRAGFVALHWPYFSEHPSEIASFAGLSEHAAIAGAAMGYGLWAIRKQPIAHSPWSLATALLLIAIAASLGCIPNGCAYGREVFWQTDGAGSLAWLLRADWPDATLTHNPRWPAQALLAGGLALGLAGLMGLWWRRRAGVGRWVLPAAVLWFVAVDFMVQSLRADPALMLANWRIFQGFDVMLAGASILVLTRQILQKH